MVADHFMPAKDVRSAELQARLKRWSEEQGVTFYGQGRGGIEHTLLCEEGWIVPGVGDRRRRLPHLHVRCARRVRDGARVDRHRLVPRSRLVLAGGARDDPDRPRRPPGELRHGQGRDPRRDRADRRRRRRRTRCSSSSARAPRRSRSTSASPSRTWRSRRARRPGIFPADEAVEAYLEGRARSTWTPERSDPDATFRQRLEIDLSALEPLVALPHLPGNVKPVSEARRGRRSTRSTSATARTGR